VWLMAMRRPESLLWASLWPVVVLAACRGYGLALGRAAGHRLGLASSMICGLAVLLVASVVLSRLGMLSLDVQLGALAAGLACGAVVPAPPERGPTPAAAVAGGIAILAGLAAIAIARLDLVFGDGVNHTFVIKHLWDTGGLPHLPHQLGGDPLAESYFSIVAGSHAAALTPTAVAPALLVALLYERLAGRSRIALAVLGVLAIPILIAPAISAQWLPVTLHVAAFFTLGDAIAARRTGWPTIACALALAAARHEYIPLALPYVAAAILLPRDLPRSRRGALGLLAGWTVFLVVFQAALAEPILYALLNGALLLVAVPLTRALLALLGDDRPRGPAAVLCFTSIAWGLAVVLEAIRTAQHDSSASFAVWLAFATCIAAAPAAALAAAPLAAAPATAPEPAERSASRLHPEVAAAVLALLLIATTFTTNFGYGRPKLTGRLYEALTAIKQRPATGAGLRGHLALRALQDQLPAGAPIAFWGQSAAELDFTRNPITDISWPVKRHRDELFLQPIDLRSLRGKDFVLVERVRPAPPLPGSSVAPWSLRQPTVDVQDALHRIACVDIACAYSVLR